MYFVVRVGTYSVAGKTQFSLTDPDAGARAASIREAAAVRQPLRSAPVQT